MPIYVRLHLFKAILAYHRGRKGECREQLDLASDKLRQTQIDEEKLVQVMAMGFGSVEARLALRASGNDVAIAMDTIFRKKQRQKEARQLELTRKLEKEFGRTKSGQAIEYPGLIICSTLVVPWKYPDNTLVVPNDTSTMGVP